MRSLSRAGHSVILGVTDYELSHGFVHRSNVVAATWLHPDILQQPQDFDAALLNYLQQNPRVDAIFPVGENSVRKLAQLESDLPDSIKIAMPGSDILDACFDKPRAYQIAHECGVPVPETRVVRTREELQEAVADIGLPLIIKAQDSTSLLLGRKCIFIREQVDFDVVSSQWENGQTDYVVQREIAGPRFNCDVVAQAGQIKLYLESRILRTDQHDYAGNSVSDRSIAPTQQRRACCEKFLAEIGYTGVALIQFLHDTRSGKDYFIEANPRAGSTIGLAVHCGVDLPARSLDAHCGASITDGCDYPVGQTQNWLHGDLLGLRKDRKDGHLGRWQMVTGLCRAIADFLRADSHTTFVWRDPVPTLVLYRNLLFRTFSENKEKSD